MGRNAARRRALKPPRRPIIGQYVPAVPWRERPTREAKERRLALLAEQRPMLCARCGRVGVSEPHKDGGRCRTCGEPAKDNAVDRWVRGELPRLPRAALDGLFAVRA